MKKSIRINRIKDIAANNEQLTIQAMGRIQRKTQGELDRLNSLVEYRKDFADKFAVNSANGVSALLMSQYKSFLEQMDIAVRQQEKAVKNAEQELLNSRSAWAKAHRKTRSFEKLVEKFSAAEAQIQANREQMEIDDRPKRR